MSPQFAERAPMEMASFPTSAGETMLGGVYVWLIFVGGALSVPGTTSEEGLVERRQALISQAQTNSGVQEQALQSASSAIMELRRLSGLTWDQLARLFGVTPRSLHFWVSGKPLTPTNEELLNRLLATIRRLDRGSSKENRSLLLGIRKDGVIPFDLLIEGQYEQVLSLLGPGHAPARPHPSTLSVEARLARVPHEPDELVGAMQDRIHEDVSKARVPRVARDRQ